MNNKYQEALDYVNKSVCTALSCLGIDDEQSRKSLHILQELVNKETSMKVTDVHVDEFYCPKCHCEITHDRSNSVHPQYCEECGQKLDWSDIDE